MLTSLAILILIAFLSYALLEKVKLPGILGFIFTGLLLGPHGTNFIHPKILEFTSDFKLLALIIILLRAGFALQLNEIKENRKLILSFSFLPLLFESLTIALLLYFVLNVPFILSLIAGVIISPIAPAVVIPQMLKLKEDLNFPNKKIPNILLASTSLDNIWALSLFGVLITLAGHSSLDLNHFFSIPLGIFNGLLLGAILAYALLFIFKRVHIRDTKKVFIILFLCVLFSELSKHIPLSHYVSIITMALILLLKQESLAHRLAQKFAKLWILAELLLFVLIGAHSDLKVLQSVGLIGVTFLLAGGIIRYYTMKLSMYSSHFNSSEKRFAANSFIPKATIQAALGGIPLQLGLPYGELILALSTLSILLSVPFGAILSQLEYRKILKAYNK